MTERNATIASRVGLHARPAAIFAEAAGEFENLDITIARLGEPEDEAMDAARISVLDREAVHRRAQVARRTGGEEIHFGAQREKSTEQHRVSDMTRCLQCGLTPARSAEGQVGGQG